MRRAASDGRRDSVPVAVIGAGNMGRNHARVYDELGTADLVEVVEPDTDRAAEVAATHDVEILDHHDEIDRARAASVAVPNPFHREVAVDCLDAGLDLLVEKPLALSVADARAIRDAASDRVLAVGHVERHNPAVRVLSELLTDRELIALEAHRLGPFNESLTEESVIFDLMIHDLDVIRSLVGAEVETLNAMGSEPRSDALDYAVAQFRFENDVVGTATASHVTHGKVRTLDVTTRELYVTLDYQRQNLEVQRRGSTESTPLLDEEHRIETLVETPYVRTSEPLRDELEEFLDCVGDRSTPTVDGDEGLRAVEFASAVTDRIRADRGARGGPVDETSGARTD